MTRGKREAKPLLFGVGFALVLSLTGFFASWRRSHRGVLPPPSLPPSSDVEPELGASAGILDGEIAITQNKVETLAKISPRAPASLEEESPFPDSSGDEEDFPGFALSESNNLFKKEPEDVQEIIPVAPLTEDCEIRDAASMEEEIKYLRNLVQSLHERERCLEMRLLEYHGLKEQEAFISELQNRLKINATESKLLSLKIETLKAENEKLRSEASDYRRVVAELEVQKKNATLLQSRLESIGERAKEKIAALHTRITELREREKKELERAAEVEMKLKRLDEVEHEVMELRKVNSRLLQDRSELMRKLASGYMLNSSVIRSPDSVLKNLESGWSMEEPNHLREENEKLKNDMEQLRTDRCAEIEELVYLKWLNACLRYELRDHKAAQGGMLARDLSRSLSPNSEKNVKQLILEYSNSGFNLGHSSSSNFYFEGCSSDGLSDDTDETSLGSLNTKSSKSSKTRFLGKLKKLVLGNVKSEGNPEKKLPFSTMRRKSTDTCLSGQKDLGSNSTGVDLYGEENRSIDGSLAGASMAHNGRRHDLAENHVAMGARCKSDIGDAFGRRRLISVDGCLNGLTFGYGDNEEDDAPEKLKLKKFARVLGSSQRQLKLKRRTASLSFA